MIWIALGLLAAAFVLKAAADARAEYYRRAMLGSLLLRSSALEAALIQHASAINDIAGVLETHFRSEAEAARVSTEAMRERLKVVEPDDDTKH